jgi:hypothetical protein
MALLIKNQSPTNGSARQVCVKMIIFDNFLKWSKTATPYAAGTSNELVLINYQNLSFWFSARARPYSAKHANGAK